MPGVAKRFPLQGCSRQTLILKNCLLPKADLRGFLGLGHSAQHPLTVTTDGLIHGIRSEVNLPRPRDEAVCNPKLAEYGRVFQPLENTEQV